MSKRSDKKRRKFQESLDRSKNITKSPPNPNEIKQSANSSIKSTILIGLFVTVIGGLIVLVIWDRVKRNNNDDPILNLYKIDSIGFIPNKPFFIGYTVINMRDQVVEIIGTKMGYNYAPEGSHLATLEGIENTLDKAALLQFSDNINNQPNHKFNIESKELITQEIFDLVKSGRFDLYCGIGIFYINPKDHNKYEFKVMLKLNGKNGIEVLNTKNSVSPK